MVAVAVSAQRRFHRGGGVLCHVCDAFCGGWAFLQRSTAAVEQGFHPAAFLVSMGCAVRDEQRPRTTVRRNSRPTRSAISPQVPWHRPLTLP